MIRLPPQTLPALAAVLALLVIIECLLPGARPRSGDRLAAIPATAPDGAADAIVNQWGDTTLARPLFHPDRRPVAAAAANTDGSLPRLSAIIIIGTTPAAVFAADGQKPQVVGAGGMIGGYRLQRIDSNAVELLGPQGELTVRPQFLTPPAQPQTATTPAISEENSN
jgi:general secretion pathway protein N